MNENFKMGFEKIAFNWKHLAGAGAAGMALGGLGMKFLKKKFPLNEAERAPMDEYTDPYVDDSYSNEVQNYSPQSWEPQGQEGYTTIEDDYYY